MLTETKPVNYELNIGQLVISRFPAIMTCYGLGSCIGVFLYDEQSVVAGGAHVMLPGSGKLVDSKNYEYAENALRDLQTLVWKFNDHAPLKAKITGGANVMNNDPFQVGKRNIEAVKTILTDLNVKIVREDVGGKISRTARFYFPENKLEIKTSLGEKYTI